MNAAYRVLKQDMLRGSLQEAGQLPGTWRDERLHICAQAGTLPVHASMSDKIAAVNTMIEAFSIHRKKSLTQDTSRKHPAPLCKTAAGEKSFQLK